MKNRNKKIVSLSAIIKKIRNLKGKKIIFTNGCFDILHYGHVKYLRDARDKGDILIVGLNSDKSVRKIKGKNKPINPQFDRAEVLSALEAVDYVVIFDDDTPFKLINSIKPHVLIKGADWQKRKIVGADILKAYGGKVATIPLVKNRSTSKIIKKIARLF